MPIATPASPAWLTDLSGRLAEVLSTDVVAGELRPLAGGACQDNFRVDLTIGGTDTRFALRSDARVSLPGSLDRRAEYEVVRLAVAHGVPTPAARYVLDDLLRPGATAYLMDWCLGVAIGSKILKDPALERARELLPDQLAAAMASIHRVRPEHAPDLVLEVPQSAGDGVGAVEAALRFNREMLDALPAAHPELELVLRWLGDHAPAPRELTLVHGDFRLGNLLVGPDGLLAVLDWEFAHWGSPMADLGWLCVRDWRFGRLDRPAGGLATRAEFFRRYEAHSGTPVDRAEVHWWEVCGNLRWAAGACYQAERVLSGQETDLELLAIGRRACEMAFEALRLIDVGPE